LVNVKRLERKEREERKICNKHVTKLNIPLL
jgi:hypothetical protein